MEIMVENKVIFSTMRNVMPVGLRLRLIENEYRWMEISVGSFLWLVRGFRYMAANFI